MKVLDLTLPTPTENLACDEALLDAAEAGQSGEVLRFWESPEHFVVVGYANKVATEVNVAACEGRGIPILRRCSGGGTVVQGPGCLNYALVLEITEGGPTRNISAANEYIMERNRAAIRSAIGNRQSVISVCGHTDLAMGEHKFSGNSQRRRKNFLLFHGTLLLNFDLKLVSELLNMPSLQPDYREGRAHGDFISNLGLPVGLLKTSLQSAWAATDVYSGKLQAEIAALVRLKYATGEWNQKF
jgi:lipoate-protein ligase A